eukprot:CCRYP_004346-RA/>CCRYP_004346-RA protein AED:0.01 eAED:0.01 QI:312/1/1/1/1/1/2/962/338
MAQTGDTGALAPKILMFDDSILMPPPAPRFKRPRSEVNAATAAATTTTMTAGVCNSIVPAASAVYDDEYFCVSPDDDDGNAQDYSKVGDVNDCSIKPNAIDFERVKNIETNMEACFVRNDSEHAQNYRKQQEQEEESSVKKKSANYREDICDNVFIPSTKFRDIIGQGPAKLRLDEALLPLALPSDLADSVLTGIRAAPVSILLHGPPGCGKTKLAQAVAGEARAAFLSVGPSDILSKFVGESEASIRGLFREGEYLYVCHFYVRNFFASRKMTTRGELLLMLSYTQHDERLENCQASVPSSSLMKLTHLAAHVSTKEQALHPKQQATTALGAFLLNF